MRPTCRYCDGSRFENGSCWGCGAPAPKTRTIVSGYPKLRTYEFVDDPEAIRRFAKVVRDVGTSAEDAAKALREMQQRALAAPWPKDPPPRVPPPPPPDEIGPEGGCLNELGHVVGVASVIGVMTALMYSFAWFLVHVG